VRHHLEGLGGPRGSLSPPDGIQSLCSSVCIRPFIYRCTRDTGEAGKKPFSNGFNRIDHRFRYNPAVARSDVKRKDP
jgi:hypothetical protein